MIDPVLQALLGIILIGGGFILGIFVSRFIGRRTKLSGDALGLIMLSFFFAGIFIFIGIIVVIQVIPEQELIQKTLCEDLPELYIELDKKYPITFVSKIFEECWK